jgi:pimeloyl-ACP methyl ester carboxylesterase
MQSSTNPPPYQARRRADSRFETLRGLRQHVRCWGGPELVTPERAPLLLMHGWMDVGASFQFVVDALAAAEGFERWVLAPDWRGFGLSQSLNQTGNPDSYWFPDYLGDLDAWLDRLWPEGAVDLAGHSMGGNVVMLYAGLRPGRVRRLINLEGFGLPATRPEQAPGRLLKWLDELKTPERLRPYPDLAAVAARLQTNDPLLSADKAAWLAPHWARPMPGGGYELQADPAHKRVNPALYQVPEVLQMWSRIAAPVLWVEGDQSATSRWWGRHYSHAEFMQRLAVVPAPVRKAVLAPCGHMLHHDQPEALARELAAFLA